MIYEKDNWKVHIRRAWLKGRKYPVYIDPTISVNGNDIHLYAASGGGCFAGDTLILMDDGSTSEIKELQIGDETTGGQVIATMCFGECDLYEFNGIYVTREHPVKHNSKWKLVYEVFNEEKAPAKRERTYLIETESKTLTAVRGDRKVKFAAFDGARGHYDLELMYQRQVVNILNTEEQDADQD